MRHLITALLLSGALAGGAQAQTPPPPAKPAGSFVGPAIQVTDVEKSAAFYRDMIGMAVRLRFGEKGRQDIMVGFGSDPSQPSILLISDKDHRPPRRIEHGFGYSRLVLFLADLDGAYARLKQGGYAAEPPREVHGTSMMMMATDPDGYRLELIGAKPRR